MSPQAAVAIAPVVALAVLVGCTGAPEVDTVPLPGPQAAACEEFVSDLPPVLDGLEALDPSDGSQGRSYGDPAVVVSCGVERPEGLDRFSPCEEVEEVGWFLSPDEAYDDPAADVSLTTIGVEPPVRVDVPGEQRPPADVLAVLSPLVREHLRVVRTCV